MSKENKKLIKYLGIIFIAVVLTYKLPHDSYSIIQYLISPIRTRNGVIFLSGIIPLILFIIGFKGLSKLERFADTDSVVVFIAVVIIVIPLMRWTLDISRTGYHWIKDDGLRAVDIKESNISLQGSNDELIIKVNMELKYYSRKQNKFNVRVYLPETLKEYTGKEFYELENHYYTHKDMRMSHIQENITVKIDDSFDESKRSGSQWFWEDMEYELYNSDETVRIIHHGL